METEQKKFNMKPELLSLLLQKGFWNNYRNKVLKTMFPEPFDKLYKTIAKFHEEHDEDLDKNKLWESIKIDYPTLTDAQRRELAEAIQDVKDAVPWTPEFANKVLTANWKQEVFRQITEIGLKGSHGVVDSLEPIADIMEQHAPQFVPKEKFDECSMNIDELMDSDTNEKKWHFAIPELKSRLGGMHGGQFLQLMARPDCGKTAMIVHQVCGIGGYAAQGAVIDWYCNEEPVKRTRWRCISSWTGMPKEKLIENREHARQLFEQISKNVRTFDIPFGTPVEHIMQRTRQRKPDIVIVDQLDKLGVTSMTGGGFAGETERLRMLYVKFREIAKRTNALVIGVCQASADAEGQRFVTYDMAENSKTGKAAECDVFLGIGKAPNTGLEEDYTRWITVSKSKLDSGWKGSIMCKLIPQISRYEGG